MIKSIKLFLCYLKPYWFQESIVFIFMILSSISTLAFPYIMKIIIDDIFPNQDFSLLIRILAILLAINVARILISLASDYLYTQVSNFIMRDMRQDLFNHIIRLPLSFFNQQKTGDIVHRINNEINVIQQAITASVLRFVHSSLTIIGLTVALCWLNWRLFVLSIVVLPFLFFNVKFFHPRIRKNTEAGRKKNSEILSFFVERFENILLIQSYNRQNYESVRLDKKIRELIGINLKNVIYSSSSQNISALLISLTPVMIFAWGGHQVMTGMMTLGALVAFLQYLSRIFDPLRDLMSLYVDLLRTSVSMKRVFEFLEIPVSGTKNSKTKNFPFEKEIRFRDVNFGYNGQDVLNDFNLTLFKGKKYALVGSSGCGKSTVINLLCQFYHPDQGSISLDNLKLAEIDTFELRQRIALVTQDNQLFHDTIWENIRYGNFESPSDAVLDAADQVGIGDLVRKNSRILDAGCLMPDAGCEPGGVKNDFQDDDKGEKDSDRNPGASRANSGCGGNCQSGCSEQNSNAQMVGEKGSQLSGGQRQRIAIARAILKNAEILILDEATSALDSESERAIFKNLQKLYQNKTMILISHRLSAIRDVDEIICMDAGRVVEQGSHTELISRKGFYWQLFREQIE